MTNEKFRNNIESIEETIGYHFKNWHLLQQAFIRRTFSKENGGENNEVLEFIGDKVLDYIVVQILDDTFGSFTEGEWKEYHSKKTEGQLTELKKKLVDGTMLAHRIDILGLSQYLLMGKGDIKDNAQDKPKVKEDLFEAIIGAIAMDSYYDQESLYKSVRVMLEPNRYIDNGFDFDVLNYIAEVQHWQQCFNGKLPRYDYYTIDGGFQCKITISNPENEYYTKSFNGYGMSKAEARMGASEEAYKYLDDNGFLEEEIDFEEIVGEPDPNKSIEQLNILATKEYISQPEYNFEETYDNNGNPVWKCTCDIEGYDEGFVNISSSKKEAKRLSAYEMYLYICGKYQE